MSSLKASLFTQLLREVGHARIEVTGCSMLPAILPGDVIRVEAGPAQIGDIAVFSQDGQLCAHRLLAVVDGQAIARGDANRRLDPAFPVNEILGRVSRVERRGVVLNNLGLRPWSSLMLRNSSILRRAYLRALYIRARMVGPRQSLTPSTTKTQA